MGSLDQTQGSNVVRKIALIDVSAYTPAQIVTHFNDNYGNIGWEIKQIVVIGSDKWLLAEKAT